MKRRDFIRIVGAVPAAALISKPVYAQVSETIPTPINDISMPPSKGLLIGLFNAVGREVSYDGYARVAIAQSPDQWIVEEGRAKNAREITFPIAQGSGGDVTHFAIYTDQGQELFSGRLTETIHVDEGTQVQFPGKSIIHWIRIGLPEYTK